MSTVVTSILKALSSAGVQIQDDGGNLGVFISDGGNVLLGTTDDDGTPATGKLVVKGSTADGTTNVQVWRDSAETNVASMDTDGNLTITKLAGTIRQTNIVDASTTHAITDPADSPADADALRDDLVTNTIPTIETALNNLGTKINAILTALEAAGILAAS